MSFDRAAGDPGLADQGPAALAVAATLLQTPSPDCLEVIEAVVEVDPSGMIRAVHDRSTEAGARVARQALSNATESIELGPDAFLLPGLVDLHIHAPQWPQLGTGLDLPLERWLFDYTFPLEARYADRDFAVAVWDDLVTTLLAHGTTTAVYHSSIHLEATTELARTCANHGQRALVGRVAMDHPSGTPEWYRDHGAQAAVEASARSVAAISAIASPLVEAIITPRFTPACTDALLTGLAELADASGVRVQTHCSESDWQHAYALERFGTTDTVALDRLGLLRDRTVLAHGDHLDDADFSVIVDRQAGVAHCPLSNSYFANAVFPARRALAAGVRVGLGSDIAGGAEPSLLSQCHYAVTMSRLLGDGVDPSRSSAQRGVPGSQIDAVTAFWMATAGGAAVLDLPVGLIEAGRWFDAIAVTTNRPSGNIRIWDDLDGPPRIFEKIVRLARAGDLSRVWVAGATVGASQQAR